MSKAAVGVAFLMICSNSSSRKGFQEQDKLAPVIRGVNRSEPNPKLTRVVDQGGPV